MRIAFLAAAASLAACSRTGAPASPDAAAPVAASAPAPASSSGATGALDASSSPARGAAKASADGGAQALTAAERAAVLHDLDAGRKLARAKDWRGAVAVYERALKLAPDDARLLSDMGWVAFQANDLTRAEAANQRGLACTKDPTLRAQILYNTGRVAEARGDKEAAKNAYADSLALRDDAEVKRRFASVGGVPDELREPLPCNEGHANPEAMCACLVAHKDGVMTMWDEAPTCSKEKGTPPLGDGRLSVFVWGGEQMGERVRVLAVREGKTTRPVADLGRDYEPGAFGVHNEAVVKGGEVRSVGGHTVVVVRSEQNDSDSNMAGLELCTHVAKLETVCALGDAPGSTRCTPAIPVDTRSGCGIGVEPEPNEIDADVRAAMAEVKKRASSSRATAAWSIAEDGKVTVRFVSGAKDLVPKNVLRVHSLW